jgi:hypothetical protein
MDFSAAIEAQISGRAIRKARLVWFDFLSKPLGLWNGFGRLRTGDGREWLGLGGLGQVSGIVQAINGAAPELLFTVSGVDATFAALVKGSSEEFYNRAATVFSQFMDEDWQCLDLPYAVAWGQMKGMRASRSEDGESGFVRTVSVSAETPFASKRRAQFSYVTDRDQQKRHPGDLMMSRTAGIDAKPYKWP